MDKKNLYRISCCLNFWCPELFGSSKSEYSKIFVGSVAQNDAVSIPLYNGVAPSGEICSRHPMDIFLQFAYVVVVNNPN